MNIKKELEVQQREITLLFARIAQNRIFGMDGHIERTAFYVKHMIETMLILGLYFKEMRDWDMELVISSSYLHDIGKITLPDSILNKPGKLTDEEYSVFKSYPLESKHIIEQLEEKTGSSEFLTSAKQFAAYHRENWDGSGYPHGLKGNDIPLKGRIMAIADEYDELTSESPYKKAYTKEKAIEIIRSKSGTRFDPDLVEIFCSII